MIAVFPNPYNLRRQVIVLFGCHRSGQFSLDSWLRSDEANQVLSQVRKSIEHCRNEKRRDVAVQVIVEGVPHGSGIQTIHYQSKVERAEGGSPYWLTPLSLYDPGNGFEVDDACNSRKTIYDLSLLLTLPDQLRIRLDEEIQASLGHPDVYRDETECGVGLHVTLYEFSTHDVGISERQSELDELSKLVSTTLQKIAQRDPDGLPSETMCRVRQLLLPPRALFAYVDFLDRDGKPTSWLDGIRCLCDAAVREIQESQGPRFSELLNRRRVPFPLHITLCRFNRKLPREVEATIKQEVDRQYPTFRTSSVEYLPISDRCQPARPAQLS
jgi:hypothetical protein